MVFRLTEMRIFIDPDGNGCFQKCFCYMPQFSENTEIEVTSPLKNLTGTRKSISYLTSILIHQYFCTSIKYYVNKVHNLVMSYWELFFSSEFYMLWHPIIILCVLCSQTVQSSNSSSLFHSLYIICDFWELTVHSWSQSSVLEAKNFQSLSCLLAQLSFQLSWLSCHSVLCPSQQAPFWHRMRRAPLRSQEDNAP